MTSAPGDGLLGFGALPLVGQGGRVIFSDISRDLLEPYRTLAGEMGVLVKAKGRAFDAFRCVLRRGGRFSHGRRVPRRRGSRGGGRTVPAAVGGAGGTRPRFLERATMPRVRDILAIGTLPAGPLSSLTDVPGVRVGHASLRGGRLRTGVTAVIPHGGPLYRAPVPAAAAVLNGYGKSVGLMQIGELGTLETPVLLTSTLNVPRVADALVSWMLEQEAAIGDTDTVNPVVLECFDGYLSDARARAVGEVEVRTALAEATTGPVPVGCVGAGVGMRCLGFKSGVGMASRIAGASGYVVGVLAVPNFGFAGDLTVAGVPVGRALAAAAQPPERGSCVFVVATDAPAGPGLLRRMAWRCFLGMARTGAISGVTSGDLAVAFAVPPARPDGAASRRSLAGDREDRDAVNLVFRALVECAEEAILDALFAAETTEGRDDRTLPALPVGETVALLRRHGAPGLRPAAAAGDSRTPAS